MGPLSRRNFPPCLAEDGSQILPALPSISRSTRCLRWPGWCPVPGLPCSCRWIGDIFSVKPQALSRENAMITMPFIERHAEKIQGVVSCFDRVVLTGTLPGICYAAGMTAFLNANHIRIFDYPRWAEPLRDEIRQHAEALARENGLEIDFIRKKNFRKEQRVKQIIAQRGDHPGLVHIFSAMESCASYKPWHDKKTHQTFLKPTNGRCLHYYFYFILPELGLCSLRVPTWAPFRLQFYYNGHNELAANLRKNHIDHQMLDNAFVQIDDFAEAQRLADEISPKQLHRRLDEIVEQFCPIIRHFPSGYHWSIMQLEYATDIVFRRQAELKGIYDELVRTAVHAVKASDVATFLGRKLHANYQGEIGNDYHTRIQGTRIKHSMGVVSIKMYDKHGLILRIECLSNDVSFFKHHRRVEHRDGTWERKVAAVKKTVYSLPALAELMGAANRRYLRFLSTLDDPSVALRDLDKISRPSRDDQRSYRGFNLFQQEDLELFRAIVRGEFNITGFQNRHLRPLLRHKTPQQISRLLKRLRLHGLIKKIGRTYKYYLTALGRRVAATALKLRELHIIPYLRGLSATQV